MAQGHRHNPTKSLRALIRMVEDSGGYVAYIAGDPPVLVDSLERADYVKLVSQAGAVSVFVISENAAAPRKEPAAAPH